MKTAKKDPASEETSMDDQLNGRTVYAPQGQDDEDADALVDAIAGAVRLFNYAGRPIWLNEGKLIEVNQNVFREIISKHVVTARLVNRGTDWACEYSPYTPSEKELRALLARAERPLAVQRMRGTSLLGRVPKV